MTPRRKPRQTFLRAPEKTEEQMELIEWAGDDDNPEFFDAEFVDRMLMAIRLWSDHVLVPRCRRDKP